MTKLDAAAVYVGANVLILLILALGVVRARAASKVILGDGGDPGLQRAIRVHGNAAEYVPAGLIGILALALLPAAPLWAVHAGGVLLTAGRILHAIGLSNTSGRSFGRAFGTLFTWIAFLAVGGVLIWAGLQSAL
jgi:uncharacterized membrane protein YecN with MAPEG domain